MPYRSKQDIAREILKRLLEKGPCKKMEMMYAARINNKQLQSLLELLEGGELVRRHESTFSITDKGKLFLTAASNPILQVIGKAN